MYLKKIALELKKDNFDFECSYNCSTYARIKFEILTKWWIKYLKKKKICRYIFL